MPERTTVTESLAGPPVLGPHLDRSARTTTRPANLATFTATYKVEPGETVKCTFTNQKRSLIIVKKVTDPSGCDSSRSASTRATTRTASRSPTDRQNQSEPLIRPGTYSVSASTHYRAGQLESATCSNGDESERNPSSERPPGGDVHVHERARAEAHTHRSSPTCTTQTTRRSRRRDRLERSRLGHGEWLGRHADRHGQLQGLLGNLQCSGDGSDAGTVALDGSGVAHPSRPAVVPAGGLSFRGHYSGDAVYASGDGRLRDARGDQLTPTVVTDVHNADHQTITQAAIGSSVHDSATVSGSGATPTGTVSFRVYLGNLQCSGDGSDAGTVALDGSGVAHPSNSAVVPAGGLSFRGHYSGDAVYASGDGPCETLAATQLTPTVVTDVHNADHQTITQAAIGSSVHDSATVSGSGATPTGTVSFRVYLGNLQCSGDGSDAGTVALDGSGVAHPSNSAVVAAGGLSFRGHYSGDAVYASGDGPCETLAATQLTVGQGSINVSKSANPTSSRSRAAR